MHADPDAWLTRELGVCSHLARLGAAVVAPSDELPPGPHRIGGLWMTYWVHVVVDRTAPEPRPDELGGGLRALHAALAQVPVALEPSAAVLDEIAALMQGRRPAQPIRGDASLNNLLTTADGRRLWTDFEDARRGPVEADVAGLVDAARRRRLGERYERTPLEAYGAVDERVPAGQLRLHALYGDVWRAHRAAVGR